ncbi:unnamed protein product [Caenorhabditis angaria]|uniref:Translocon-associated protein subunit beta n=1 Tax=Caenorhabditis angaria TaxID=860376 RepID=A0A9P1N4Q7_9PELO|nr:unnamed protein product [Caenorhabditis angaria]
MLRFFVFAALFLAVSASDFVLVSKSFNTVYAIQNSPFTVEYVIYNKKSQDITNVELNDQQSFPTNKFDIGNGNLKVVYNRIPAGSNVTHAIVVVPKITGEQHSLPANLTYFDASRGEHVRGQSNSGHKFYIYHPSSYQRLFASRLETFAVFAMICGPITILSLFFYTISATRYEIAPKKQVKN